MRRSCSLKPQKAQGHQLQADISNDSTHMEEEIGEPSNQLRELATWAPSFPLAHNRRYRHRAGMLWTQVGAGRTVLGGAWQKCLL